MKCSLNDKLISHSFVEVMSGLVVYYMPGLATVVITVV